MDGDFAPVGAICELARRHNALTYCDEVHAVGMYGPTGAGVADERDGVSELVDVVEGTLAKAYGGLGGYIAGSARSSMRYGRMRLDLSLPRRFRRRCALQLWPPYVT